MVLDSSAIIAIFLKDVGYEGLARLLARTRTVLVGAPTLVEVIMVLTGRVGHDVRPQLMAYLSSRNVEVVHFDEHHFNIAADAFLRFGKGRHPARLNFGDCMTYAVAALAGLPLLYTGNDFSKTDIVAA